MMDLQAIRVRAPWLLFLCLIGFWGCDGTVNDAGPDAPKLVAPENGSDKQTSATELQWNVAASASFYHLQVSQKSDFSNVVVEDDHVSSDSYPLTGLEVGKTYYWRLRGGNDDGYGDWSDAWQFEAEKEGVIPPIPRLASPVNESLDMPTQISFNWKQVDGATTYHIQVSLERNFVRRTADLEGIRGTSSTIQALVPTYIYYWRVRSKNPLGYSEWSPTWFVVIEDDSVVHILG